MNFQEYLGHIGFFGQKTPEEWAFIREQYRKFYQRNYQQNYRGKFKRIESRFLLPNEYKLIENLAKKFSLKPATLVHHIVMSYLDADIYLPDFKSVEELAYLVRKSSNNTNQLVKAVHIQKYIDNNYLKALVAEYNKVEQGFREFYAKPKVIYKPINLINHVD